MNTYDRQVNSSNGFRYKNVYVPMNMSRYEIEYCKLLIIIHIASNEHRNALVMPYWSAHEISTEQKF